MASEDHCNIITPEDGIKIRECEQIDDGNTVGVADVEPGGETVSYESARQAFCHVRKRRGEWEIGDDDSHIFISSDGGDLNVSFGPEFAPIETTIKQWQFAEAMKQLGGHYPQFDLSFDDAGLVAFHGEETTVIVAPTQFPWDFPSPECGPRAPGGPTA